MALLKLGGIITEMSGKLGGQSISQTRNGVTIRNIGQGPKMPSSKQSQQRFITAGIANSWQHLTQPQRQTFIDGSVDYKYVNQVGEEITRNGFQTYCFINQNLTVSDSINLKSAPIFIPINPPVIQNKSLNDSEFVIQADNVEVAYSYVVYCSINYSLGNKTFTGIPIEIIQIDSAQLQLGFDLVPRILNTFTTEGRRFKAVIQVVAINAATGNRDLTPQTIVQQIEFSGLDLPLISYYDFIDNADDYFGLNNGVLSMASVSTNGIINSALNLSNFNESYCNYGNDPSLNFASLIPFKPFTICFWVNISALNAIPVPVHRSSNNGRDVSYLITINNAGVSSFVVYDGTFVNSIRANNNSQPALNTWHFVCAIATSATDLKLIIDTDNTSTFQAVGAFTQIRSSLYDVKNSDFPVPDSRAFAGKISEQIFINTNIDYDTAMIIRTANLNGQTIIDIN